MGRFQLAVRRLRRAPAFTAAALVILALTAGAVTLAFNAIYAIRFRPLPFRRPAELAQVMATDDLRYGRTYEDLFDSGLLHAWRAGASAFTDFTAYSETRLRPGSRLDRPISAAIVDGHFFTTLGIAAVAGRTITLADDLPGASPVVVISADLWQRAFGRDRSIVGANWKLGETSYTIVGVAVASPDIPGGDAWLSLPGGTDRHGSTALAGIGRLRAGVSFETAQAQLTALVPRSPGEQPGDARRGALVWPLASSLRSVGTTLPLFIAAIALLVAVALSNLGTIFLVRTLARARQLAISTALGATARRLRGDLAIEAAILGATAGAIGWGLAVWTSAALRTFISSHVTGRNEAIPVRLPAALFAVGFGIVVAVALALGSQATTVRRDLLRHLRGGGAGSGTIRRHRSWRRVLVAVQVAIALVATVAASALVGSSHNLAKVDVGYDADHLLVAPLDIWNSTYGGDTATHAAINRIQAAISQSPGLGRAAIWATIGFSMPRYPGDIMMAAEGSVLRFESRSCTIRICAYDIHPVSPDLFATIGIQVVSGRSFAASDDATGAPVAIINAQAAQSWWPGEAAVGKRIRLGPDDSRTPWRTVVGVVANTAPLNSLGRWRGAIRQTTVQPVIFEPIAQATLSEMGIANNPLFVGVHAVRPGISARALSTALHGAVPGLDVPTPLPMSAADLTGNGLGAADVLQLHTEVALAVTFVALLLTLFGVSVVVVESAQSRTRELGVRLALGATGGNIVRLICSDALRWIAGGIAAGVVGTVAMTVIGGAVVFGHTNRVQRYGSLLVGTVHPALLLGSASLAILLVGWAAAYAPARRASHLDPLIALGKGTE
ncbi:MAG TPA: ABC transporter permease [Gemmatimonadales bacterium]